MLSRSYPLSFLILLTLYLQSCGDPPDSEMNRYAANEEVARFMENYEGRGVLTDPDSRPTPAGEVVERFRYANDLSLELVLSEPEIVQPLQISFDQRGRLWVVQYHQYPYPEGLKITAIDNHTRVEFDKVPEAPPKGVKGADKITFFEDSNGDGHYDKATDAITGLNIATAVALGRGKIWVLNPPYLLAFPDPQGDGIPEGEPEVHLEGFGLEDTHAVANSLTWGPDGWLYGAQGSTTTANVSSSVSKNVSFLGQAIWRYHPVSEVFEIFAEGGGNNAFNVEFDSKGRLFSGTNAYDRGPYYKQGGYYIKSWGKHGPLTNPYAFGYLPNMPLEGEKLRFTHSLIKYEGGALPQKYNDLMFAINPLHNLVQLTGFEKKGSSFTNVDKEVVLETDDKWFRPVDIKLGPDGAVYISDWYDSRLSHVDPRDTWHKTSGRIYRLKGKEQREPLTSFDLSTFSNPELIALFSEDNKWFRQQAQRQLGDRKDLNAVPLLLQLMESGNAQEALEALWGIHNSGGFTDNVAEKALKHSDPFVRMWAVRLLGDKRVISGEIAEQLSILASKEPHAEVRSQLAATAKRLTSGYTFAILTHLLQHNDVDDPDIPLLIWWAMESKAILDKEGILSFLHQPEMWSHPLVKQVLLPRLMQRYTMEGGEENFAACAKLLDLAPTKEHARILIGGLQEGLLGRDLVTLPSSLLKVLEKYGEEMGVAPLTLALRQGDEAALKEALEIMAADDAELGLRLSYIQVAGEINQPVVIPGLIKLVRNGSSPPVIKQAALHALQAYDDESIGKTIAKAFPSFRDNAFVKEAGVSLFATRSSWAMDFFAEVNQSRTISKNDVPDHLAKRFKLLKDDEVDRIVDQIWPDASLVSTDNKTKNINRYGKLLSSGEGDVVQGRVLFLGNCGLCHRLNGEGGILGPDLTGYDRRNLEYLLLHTVDPNADIREGYEVQRIVTTDGRTLEGRIQTQGGGTMTFEPPLGGKATTLSEDKIKEMEVQQTSFMPERLLEKLSDQEIRDLFSYIMKAD